MINFLSKIYLFLTCFLHCMISFNYYIYIFHVHFLMHSFYVVFFCTLTQLRFSCIWFSYGCECINLVPYFFSMHHIFLSPLNNFYISFRVAFVLVLFSGSCLQARDPSKEVISFYFTNFSKILSSLVLKRCFSNFDLCQN